MDVLMIAAVASMSTLAVIFAAILAFADKKLKIEEDPKIERITAILPGVNCGACGYLSCHDYAKHIVEEDVNPAKCRVVGDEQRAEICSIMAREAPAVIPKVALVRCAARWPEKKRACEYKGARTCRDANIIFGGGMFCQYGCIGFGDCVYVCPFDALGMKDGLPIVNLKKCTGCGKCAAACPRKIIKIEEKPNDTLFYVACNSHDDTARVKEICSVGCIACGICEKLSQERFFIVKDNLSEADYSKQTKTAGAELERLASKCPTKVIKRY
ncbi:MAG: RnfABCDGE type electron transport complex subunit B [Candidatus Omnitrophica bacterium]|nr:RnfABCDGE type electron transport complex subunit B [Candidatus Omnitrophota bacterium]